MTRASIRSRWFIVPAVVLLAMAAATATVTVRSAHAQTPPTQTSATCATQESDAAAETSDTQSGDNVDLQCGDQSQADGPAANEQGGADGDQVEQGDQTSPDTGATTP